jgi:hypothetical protein
VVRISAELEIPDLVRAVAKADSRRYSITFRVSIWGIQTWLWGKATLVIMVWRMLTVLQNGIKCLEGDPYVVGEFQAFTGKGESGPGRFVVPRSFTCIIGINSVVASGLSLFPGDTNVSNIGGNILGGTTLEMDCYVGIQVIPTGGSDCRDDGLNAA